MNDLIVKSSDHGVVIALLKEGKLVELHNEKSDNSFAVGDIYLGKANKVVPGLNAAFVDVGYEKDGFLHYHDLRPQIRSFNKYVRKTISGRQHKWSLSDFKLEKIRSRLRDYPPNENDFKNIEKNIKTYSEFPNLTNIIDKNLKLSKEELESYNHLTYIELY